MQYYASLSNHSKVSTEDFESWIRWLSLTDFKKLDSKPVRYLAQYAARLSQALADAVSIGVEEILRLEDIGTAADKKSYFTDGVRTLSPALARKI